MSSRWCAVPLLSNDCPFILAAGKDRAREAALAAISSPLLEVGIEKATGVVWNITGPANMSLFEVRRTCSSRTQGQSPVHCTPT